MKFNWGTGIAIFYTTFMIIMITFVIKSKQVDHSLVVEDYYAKDLSYQSHANKLINAQSLKNDLDISQDGKILTFQFPMEVKQPTGEILLYRPSDKSKDVLIPIQTNEEKNLNINTTDLSSGLWKIKVNWEAGGKAYYKEQILTI